MAITYNAGTNLITLDDSAGAGDSWGTAYDMDDVFSADVAGSWGVVTKQGDSAYDVSARMIFVSGVYFKSTNEFVELQANPTNPAWTFRIDSGAHVQFGEYNSTDKYSYDGCRWDMPALNSGTGNSSSANRIAGEFLVYGSSIITNANNFTKGLMLIAGATVKYYNSIFKYAGYFWAADHDLRDVKWFGGGNTYDMLIAVGFSHNWAGLTTMGCNYGLFFSASTTADVDVYDADLLDTATYSVFLSSSCQYLIRLINSPSFVNTAGISSGRPGLKLCSTFNVKVTDSDGAPIVGATVELKDVDGTVVFSEDTIAGGVLTADKIVTMYWYRNAAQGGNKSFNNHTLKVSSGTDETEYDIDIDHQITEDVVLLPQSLASYDNIMAGINDIKGTGFVKDADSLVDIRPETDKIQTVKIATDKMNFTGIDIKATLDGEEVTTDTASRTASKATGFATLNPPSQVLVDYKADVSNLDVLVSSRNDITPPTVSEIRNEMEGAGTKLTNVKDKTDTLDWTDITFLKDIEGGKWKIENNQMIFSKADNITEVARFDLFKASVPSSEEPDERLRV